MSYFNAKMHKIRFRLGFRPRPHAGGAYSAPPGTLVYPSTHTTPWPHFIIDVGLVQRGYSIASPVLLKCCVASVVA